MGAMDARNMLSNLAVKKYLHTDAPCWILLIQNCYITTAPTYFDASTPHTCCVCWSYEIFTLLMLHKAVCPFMLKSVLLITCGSCCLCNSKSVMNWSSSYPSVFWLVGSFPSVIVDKPFFSLPYNCQLLCFWRLALSIAVEVFPRPLFQILLLQGRLLQTRYAYLCALTMSGVYLLLTYLLHGAESLLRS